MNSDKANSAAPIGIAVGRWIWTSFSDQLGILPSPAIPLAGVLLAVPATGVVSLLSILKVELVITVPFGSGLATCTTSCTEPEPPAATAPMFQVTTPAARAPPAVAETNVVFAGTVSVITTPVAPAVPVFEYDSV